MAPEKMPYYIAVHDSHAKHGLHQGICDVMDAKKLLYYIAVHDSHAKHGLHQGICDVMDAKKHHYYIAEQNFTTKFEYEILFSM